MSGVPQPPREKLTLTEPRRRQYRLLAINGVFVVIGTAMLATGELWGLAAVIFFGLGALASCAGIARPARLTIGRDGFRFVNLGRPSPVFTWSKTSNFHPWSPAVGVTFVAFEYEGPKPVYRGRLARLNRSLAGGNCSLPSTYGLKATELCELLERRRATHSTE